MDNMKFDEALIINRCVPFLDNSSCFTEISGNLVYSTKIFKNQGQIEIIRENLNEGVILSSNESGIGSIRYEGMIPSKNIIDEAANYKNIRFKDGDFEKYLSLSCYNVEYSNICDDLINNNINVERIKKELKNNSFIDIRDNISYYFNKNSHILQKNGFVVGNDLSAFKDSNRAVFADSVDNFFPLSKKKAFNKISYGGLSYLPLSKSVYTIFLSAQVAAIMFHEICHLFEFGEYCIDIGTVLAKSILNISMFPSWYPSFINFKYDDEGSRSKKLELVKNGIVKNHIHSKLTSLHIKDVQLGYGRRALGERYILPRMSNIVVEPSIKFANNPLDIVSQGLYFSNCESGKTDLKNRLVTLDGLTIYMIKNGELVGKINKNRCKIDLIDFMKNIIFIGNKLETINGTCTGNLPVSYTSPLVISSDIRIE